MPALAPQRSRSSLSLKRVISSSAANGSSISSRLRLGDQRARDRHAHLHAAGELARIGAGEVGQADAVERCPCTRGVAAARSAPASRSGSETLSNTVAQGISVGSWNTKPMLAGRRGSSVRASRSLPRVGSLKPGDHAQRRRLAAARRPEQRQELAARERRGRGRRARRCRWRSVLPTPRSETIASRRGRIECGCRAMRQLTSAAARDRRPCSTKCSV